MKHLASQPLLGFSNYFLSSILLSMPWISCIKTIYISKVTIDKSKADIGNLVNLFQCLHDGFANEGRFDLTFAQSPQVPFNTRRDGLDLFIGERSFSKAFSKPLVNFWLSKQFPAAIFFDDQERRFLVFFVSRETAPTFRALPTASD